MAAYIPILPSTDISRAMFNFDAFGIADYRLVGTIRVSVSDTFSFFDYLNYNFFSELYTNGSDEVAWTTQNTDNIKEILNIYSQFANLQFQFQGDYDFFNSGFDFTPNPADVGRFSLSDINITWIDRFDGSFAGISGASSDGLIFGYPGAAGDVFLNAAASMFEGDFTLNLNTRARQVLMHELGHSLGLSHPHSSYSASGATLTFDFMATKDLGFDQLGFHIDSASDMYKEYFTIMSYDDQQSLLPGSGVLFHAHTPMILDVIALQQVYGEGPGSTGSGNDTIQAGNAGYRTYFDKGGVDTIDLSTFYTEGAYLQMGVTIKDAAHLVGVAMSLQDAQTTITFGGDPKHLRWFYGEYENAVGASHGDLLVGNSLNNVIRGLGGDDVLQGGGGNDTLEGGSNADRLDGGAGNDRVLYKESSEGLIADLQQAWVNTGIAQGDTYESIEHLYGSNHADSLRGDTKANTIWGAAGNDTLFGRGGNDTLVGGRGHDTFVFDTTLGAAINKDRVTDFNVSDDSIKLENDVFTALSALGKLAAASFYVGARAHDASDRIIYNAANGALLYDADGKGGTAGIQFATLSADLKLTRNDFIVI